MPATPESLAVLGILIASAAVAVLFAIVRLVRSGRTVPPPWAPPPPTRRRR